MRSRAVRLTLLVLFVVACGVTAYIFWMGETRARTEADAGRAFDVRAFGAARDILQLRAAQQAYVAAGQGDLFWIAEVAKAIASVRDSLGVLRAAATSVQAQTAIDDATSTLQEFEQLDRRARDYSRAGHKLLASDLIFTDGLQMAGAAAASLEASRVAEQQFRDTELAGIRSRQRFGLGAAAAAALLTVLLLVPRAEPDATDSVDGSASIRFNPPVTTPSATVDTDESWAPAKPVHSPPAPTPPEKAATPASVVRQSPAVGPPPVAPLSVDLAGVAAVCTDLARIVDTESLPAILARAANALDASGIVLWISDPDGSELSPIITHGYDHQFLVRLGTIRRDAENVTAAAFRTGLVQVVRSDAVSNGAIAAPLMTPSGPVGVMSAETRNRGELQPATVAAATIVAAQLGMLVGPPSSRAPAKVEAGA